MQLRYIGRNTMDDKELLDNSIAPEEEGNISDMEWAETEKDVIAEFKDFARRASRIYGPLYKRIKEDRLFESGNQWGDSDRGNRGEGRAEMTINMCNVFVNSIVNPFAAKPFKFKAEARDQAYLGAVDQLNGVLDNIQAEFGTNDSNAQGFRDAVVGGLGFTIATTENVDGMTKLKYIAVDDPTKVIIDPDAKGVALEETNRIAVVDIMLFSDAKKLFGEDLIDGTDCGKCSLNEFGASWEVPKDYVAVITYFKREGHDVLFYRLCGDRIVDFGTFEGLDYMPVFAFTGDRIWTDDGKSFAGVVRKIRTQQKTVNYAQSQLIERLAKSPKAFFLAAAEAIENYEDDYQNVEFGNNYILRYNTQNNGNPVQPPQFLQPQVQTTDLQQVIQTAINQMSLATGISANGIVEQNLTDQKTATEVLLRTKSSQSNVSNYIDHAKETVRISGLVISHIVINIAGLELPKGSYDIVVEEGCVSLTKMEEDREKLLALSNIVPDQFKPLVAQRIVGKLDIDGGKELSDLMLNLLPAEMKGGQVGAVEFQQAQQQVAALQQQIAELTEANNQLNNELSVSQMRTRTDIALKQMDYEHDVKIKQLEMASDQAKAAAEAQIEAQHDRAKAVGDLQKVQAEAQAKMQQQSQKAGLEAMAKAAERQAEQPQIVVAPQNF